MRIHLSTFTERKVARWIVARTCASDEGRAGVTPASAGVAPAMRPWTADLGRRDACPTWFATPTRLPKSWPGFCLAAAVLLPCFSRVGSLRAETILVTARTVHTVSGPTLTPGQVLISDGKIEAVEKTITTKADKVVDLDGQHLYPGLIAASTSLGLVEINAIRATRDASEVGEYTPDVEAWAAVNPDSELIPVARANGIAHFLPVPDGGIVAGQSGLMVVDGWTTEDMTVKKPVALHVFWPGMELNTTPKEEFKDKSKWKALEDQAKERREKIKTLEDFFEEARTYAKAREAGGKYGLPAEYLVPV